MQPRQSLAFDDLTSAFASLSTFDNTLEKPCPAVNSLVSSFAAFSTTDNTLEEPCAAMDKITLPFRRLSIQDQELRVSARPSRRPSRQEPKPAPEIDDLAACLGNLSCEQKAGLRSCLKDKSRPRHSTKSVNFVTYQGHPDVVISELRHFTLRKGEELGHHYCKKTRPHVPGDKYIGTEADGTIWLAKTLGLFHPPTRRGRYGKLDRW
ncbi:hypothetical protein BDZ45DRAFT_393792 [Acephala macrosclerotiorum]|nr:hypothetical protein BDZ45DRAFT_393792 [Acephala macrosclerotiorum]